MKTPKLWGKIDPINISCLSKSIDKMSKREMVSRVNNSSRMWVDFEDKRTCSFVYFTWLRKRKKSRRHRDGRSRQSGFLSFFSLSLAIAWRRPIIVMLQLVRTSRFIFFSGPQNRPKFIFLCYFFHSHPLSQFIHEYCHYSWTICSDQNGNPFCRLCFGESQSRDKTLVILEQRITLLSST